MVAGGSILLAYLTAQGSRNFGGLEKTKGICLPPVAWNSAARTSC